LKIGIKGAREREEKMRNRFFYLALVLLAATLFFGGTANIALAEKTITLKFSCWSPAGGKGFADNVDWFLDDSG
jgi:hypothetical protein